MQFLKGPSWGERKHPISLTPYKELLTLLKAPKVGLPATFMRGLCQILFLTLASKKPLG